MEAFWLARQKSGLLSQQAQESARYTPDPFPRERVGSGDETKENLASSPGHTHLSMFCV